MGKTVKTAEFQLLQLINKLSDDSEILNDDQFVSVLNATKSICSNGKFVDALIQTIKIFNDEKNNIQKVITQREKQVLLLIGKGLRNAEIASEFNLSRSTIETHRKNIRKKLKFNGSDSLFTFALLFSLQYRNDVDS